MMNWIKTKLGKIGKEVRSSYKPNKEQSLAYIGYEHIDQQTLRLIGSGKSNETQSDKKRFSAGDIIFGTLRPYFRKVVIPDFSGVCSTDLAVIRAQEGYDQKFLFYILASQPLIDYADVSSNGTKMPRAKWNVLAQTEWLVPNFFSQQRIASILSAYDDLIEVNNQRITLLEETASQLYKEWFVRMRFPGYQNTKFEKGIPTDKGEVKYFKDFIKLNRGFDLPDEKIIKGPYPVIASTGIKAFHNQFKIKAPVITTGRSGSLGTVLYVNKDGWALNTSLYVKEFKGNHPLFVYFLLKQLDFETFNSGAGVPTLNQNHLHKLKLWIPDDSLQSHFSKIVEPMFTQVENLQQQNNQLRHIRDRLLPRLISGKLQVQTEKKGTVIPMTVTPELNIVAEEKASYKKSNPYFKRRVLAAYIIDKLKDQSTFGHVKLMKLMFLCEYLVKIETASNYHRDAAGPYDNKMMRSIDAQLKKSNWFEAIKIQRENYTCYIYKPLAMCSEYNEWFEKYYADKKNLIDELIALFGTQKTQKVEMVATLYKAWLDLSKQQDYVSEDELVYEVLNNWHDSKKQIDESRWRKCIVWMNNKQWITT